MHLFGRNSKHYPSFIGKNHLKLHFGKAVFRVESPSRALHISRIPWSMSCTLKSQIQPLPMEKTARRKEGVIYGPGSTLLNSHTAPTTTWRISSPSYPRTGPSPGTILCSHHLESRALIAPSTTSTRAIIGVFLRFYMRSFSIILRSISAQPGEGMYNLFCYLIELVVLSLLCQYKP